MYLNVSKIYLQFDRLSGINLLVLSFTRKTGRTIHRFVQPSHFAYRGRLKVSHTDGSPRCVAPTFDLDWLENEVWTKISDILNNLDKLTEVIKDSLEMLKAKQVELDHIIKPIDEKLAQIIDKKAKLPDEWVLSNTNPDKYKELQSYLNKEEMRLKPFRANIHPARLIELESVKETL